LGCGPKAPPTNPPVVVRYQTVRLAAESPLHRQAQYVGILRGDRETDLSFRVSGTVERIGPPNATEGWTEGTSITDHQSLALLNQTDFESAVTNARAWTTVREKSLQRTEKLFDQNTVSLEERDLARANWESAQAALRKAEQELTDSHLRAPWPGVILARYASAGETILPGHTVLRVADLATMSLELGLPDTLVSIVVPGQRLPVEISGLEGQPFTGEVSEVGVAAKAGTRLFKVVIKLPNPKSPEPDGPRQLRAGMSATVDFGALQPPPTNAVVVPLAALVASPRGGPNRLAVFVLDDTGVAREREVGTGDLIRSSVLVTHGLKVGERVVTFGAANLADGLMVKALPENGLEGKP
jgi:RND family efflux transporter MFP subunit